MLASAVAVALLGLGCVILAALAWFLWRSRAQALKQKAGQEAGKDMKNLIYQSAYTLGPSASATTRPARNIIDCKQMAFVVTGADRSTFACSAVPTAHRNAQFAPFDISSLHQADDIAISTTEIGPSTA